MSQDHEDTGNLGRFIIEPNFLLARSFRGGLAAVKVGIHRAWGFINSKGKLVIEPDYDEAESFSEGRAAVKGYTTRKWGYINTEGNIAIAQEFDFAGEFKNGLAAVKYSVFKTLWDEKSAVLDLKGSDEFYWSLLCLCASSEIESPEKVIAVSRRSSYTWVSKPGFIDRKGNLLLDYTVAKQDYPFSEGLREVRSGNPIIGKFGYANADGQILIDPKYDDAQPFSEGLAAVFIGNYSTGKWGFIDKNGDVAVDFIFDDARPFSEGLAAVGIGDYGNRKWGFIDKTGNLVIEAKFDGGYNVEGFSEGLAVVKFEGRYGYIQGLKYQPK